MMRKTNAIRTLVMASCLLAAMLAAHAQDKPETVAESSGFTRGPGQQKREWNAE